MGDYPDNAERFALFCRAVLEASKVLGVPDVLPLPRLADGADSHTFEVLSTSKIRHFATWALRFHHSQHWIPGTVPAGYAAAADASLGLVHHLQAGVLRQGELPEGCASSLPISSPRSAAAMRRRSRPPSTALGWKAFCARAGNRRGNSERRGLREVESRRRTPTSQPITAPRIWRARPRASRICWPSSALPEDTQSAGDGHCLALCRAKGLRPDPAVADRWRART